MRDNIKKYIEISVELKDCIRSGDFAKVSGLIENWQSLGNKVESMLYDIKDLKSLRSDVSELKKELKELEAKKKELDKLISAKKEK